MSADRRRCLAIFLAALLAGSCQSVLGPTDIEGDWTAPASEHFTLHVRPESFAEQSIATITAWLEDQYAVTNARLELAYAGRVTGLLYPSAAEAGRTFDRSGTGYPETESFKAVCTAPLDDSLFHLLAHEANHVILWVGLGRGGTTLMRDGLPSASSRSGFTRRDPRFCTRGRPETPAACRPWPSSRTTTRGRGTRKTSLTTRARRSLRT
jgi:hypothetical protein